MGSVYMMWLHKPSPGRGKLYAKLDIEEAMGWLNKQVESGVVKSVKMLRMLSGKDGSILLVEFADMSDAHKYLKDFQKSGLAVKFMNLAANSETTFAEEYEPEEVERFFQVLSEMD